MLPDATQLHRLTQPDSFVWATGIEDTFITAPWPATGRTLDEYELTDHYNQWEGDLERVASLGVSAVRYGIPWHKVEPEPGRFVWEFADKTLDKLLHLGIDPIVDLVHYGLPPWLAGAYFNPDYPQRVAHYAHALLSRFSDRLRWYTPLNEPRITAWYCGRLGWWPPFARGWSGFARVMLSVCKGIVQTVQAAQAANPCLVACHVDATDLYDPADPNDSELVREAQTRQDLVFLALDLVSGRVKEGSPLAEWLYQCLGKTAKERDALDADLAYFAQNAVSLPVVGLNLYPMFTQKQVYKNAQGKTRVKMRYAGGDLITRLGHLYYARYNAPVMITETSGRGSVAKRQAWLSDSVAAVRDLRNGGVPCVGYTWWPMFSLVAWAYRQGTLPAQAYLEPMGLWDLTGDNLTRTQTPLVQAYQNLAQGGVGSVGLLTPSTQSSKVPLSTHEQGNRLYVS